MVVVGVGWMDGKERSGWGGWKNMSVLQMTLFSVFFLENISKIADGGG